MPKYESASPISPRALRMERKDIEMARANARQQARKAKAFFRTI